MVKQYGFRLDSDLVEIAREIAEKEERSLNFIIRRWLMSGFKSAIVNGTIQEMTTLNKKDYSNCSESIKIEAKNAFSIIKENEAVSKELGYE